MCFAQNDRWKEENGDRCRCRKAGTSPSPLSPSISWVRITHLAAPFNNGREGIDRYHVVRQRLSRLQFASLLDGSALGWLAQGTNGWLAGGRGGWLAQAQAGRQAQAAGRRRQAGRARETRKLECAIANRPQRQQPLLIYFSIRS